MEIDTCECECIELGGRYMYYTTCMIMSFVCLSTLLEGLLRLHMISAYTLCERIQLAVYVQSYTFHAENFIAHADGGLGYVAR